LTYLQHPLYTLGCIYLIILFMRAVMSWFPTSGSSGLRTFNHWLYALTEPYVAPFRRVIPPAGMFDISYMIAVLVVLLLTFYLFPLVKV
jgi:YggT family protein